MTGALASLHFTDLYFPMDGEAPRIKGLAASPRYQAVPGDCQKDAGALLAALEAEFCRRRSSGKPADAVDQRFFAVEHEGVRYRVTLLGGRLGERGATWAVRKPLSPLPQLTALGIPYGFVTRVLEFAAGSRGGLYLVVGPFGAGKTTMASLLARELAIVHGQFVLGWSDPPELAIDGDYPGGGWVRQYDRRDEELADALYEARRSSADLFLIGEIRSPLGAAAAVQAALNGRPVLATIHGGDLVAGITALETYASVSGGEQTRTLVAEALAGAARTDLQFVRGGGRALLVTDAFFCGETSGCAFRDAVRRGSLEALPRLSRQGHARLGLADSGLEGDR